MAGEDRGSFSDLKLDLLKEGHRFSFYQVIRLLRFFGDAPASESHKRHSDKTDHLRLRPKLSLAFPPSDIDTIEKLDDDPPRFLVTSTLPGLYGSSSPLPTFYTEDLMDEAASDESVTRDFVDIINHRLLLLLFKCWTKYRQFLQVVEEKNDDYLIRLFSLLGLGEEVLRLDVPDAYGLIRYLGLFTQFPRSGLGLKTLLQDAFGGAAVEICCAVPRKAKIPVEQRAFLGASGCRLGEECFLGEQVDDRMGKFGIRIGPLKADRFQRLLPGGKECERLAFLTKFYVIDRLEYDVELTLAEREAQGVCLGRPAWSRLGWDTWIFSGDDLGEVTVRFSPELNAYGVVGGS
jgi:type VI secretion system protein ImpH